MMSFDYYKESINAILRWVHPGIKFKESNDDSCSINCIFKHWHNNYDNVPSAQIRYSNPPTYKCYTCGMSGKLEFVMSRYMRVADPNIKGKLDQLIAVQKAFATTKLPSINLLREEYEYKDYSFSFDRLDNVSGWWLDTLYNKGLHKKNIYSFLRQYKDDLIIPYFKNGQCVGARKRFRVKPDWGHKYTQFYEFKFSDIMYLDWLYSGHQHAMILVEGELDALHLLQYGLPVMSISSAQNWSTLRRDYLFDLFNPVGIMIIPDEDVAGLKSAEKVRKSLDEYLTVKVERFKKDPKKILRREIYDKFTKFQRQLKPIR